LPLGNCAADERACGAGRLDNDRIDMQRLSGLVVKTGAIALAMAFAGCGGGGGGDSTAGVPSAGAPAPGVPVADAPVQRTVQGTAAKGLIKGATVSLYAIDAQGVRAATALGTATTGADGTYKLQIPASVQNFVIEVTAAPGATMADEATGTDIALPTGMKLRSVVTLADGASGTYEGTVSPLTEMVVRTAETTDGKLPKQAIAQAKANVRTLLGFDPETVKPINSNSDKAAGASEDEKNQSLALAAISQMASTVTADCGQSNPGERISCVVKQLSGSVKVEDGKPSLEQNRLAAFRDALKTVAEDKKINHTGKDKVVGIPVISAPAPTTTTTPTPTVPVKEPLSPVAATKALFASVRTNLQAIDKGNALQATADAIKADLNSDLLPLSNDVSGFGALALNALEQFDRYRKHEISASTFQVWQYQLYPGDTYPIYNIGEGSGNCTIHQDSLYPLSMLCTTVHLYSIGQSSTANTIIRDYVTRTVKLTPSGGEYYYEVTFQKNTATFDKNYSFKSVTSSPIGDRFYGRGTYSHYDNAILELSMSGSMPGRLDESGRLQAGAETWDFTMTRIPEQNHVAVYKLGGSFTASTSGTPNTKGQLTGKVEIDKSSFLRLATDVSNEHVLQNPVNELQVTLRGTVGTTTAEGTLRASGDKLDKSKTVHMPTSLSFDGSIKHNDATVFTGKVAITRGGFEQFDATAPESSTNFVADAVELGGTLSVPNRPVLGLTVGATRTGLDTANVSLQYRDAASVINASVSAKAGEKNPLVKVSSADGVAFSFTTGSTAPVNVTKDGAITAVLDPNKGIISYKDGTTESLK
jgi:hypothetical protein